MYNWYAVNDPRGLAPTGFHIPSDAELTTLEICLGGSSVAGGPLKETGTAHWLSPNTGATNSSGFTALPGGLRYDIGTFDYIGSYIYLWSATEFNSINAWYRYMSNVGGNVLRTNVPKQLGFSVRCLKD